MITIMHPALALPLGSLKILMTGVAVRIIALSPWARPTVIRPFADSEWLSLILLTVAVLLTAPDVLFGSSSISDTPLQRNVTRTHSLEGEQEHSLAIGVLLTIGYSTVGAFGNVMSEILLKRRLRRQDRSTQALLLQLVQLYLWGALAAFGFLLAKDHRSIMEKGAFHDFDVNNWYSVALHVIMGLFTALVFKYLNNVAFLFIQTSATLCAVIIGVPLFQHRFSVAFLVAWVVIAVALYLYKRSEIWTTLDAISSALLPPKQQKNIDDDADRVANRSAGALATATLSGSVGHVRSALDDVKPLKRPAPAAATMATSKTEGRAAAAGSTEEPTSLRPARSAPVPPAYEVDGDADDDNDDDEAKSGREVQKGEGRLL